MEHDNMSDHSAYLYPLAYAGLYGGRHGDHGGHNGHHDGLEELIQSNNIHTASVNNMKETSDAARDTADAVRDAIDAVNQIGNLNLQSSERNGGETRSTVFQAAGAVKDQAAANANQAARDFANQNRELCEIRSELAQEFGNTRLEAAKQHAEIQLEMCKQHADLAAKMAECCCETKELVRAENAATRQLLQSNMLDDANRRTATAERDLLLAKIQAGQGGPGNS